MVQVMTWFQTGSKPLPDLFLPKIYDTITESLSHSGSPHVVLSPREETSKYADIFFNLLRWNFCI